MAKERTEKKDKKEKKHKHSDENGISKIKKKEKKEKSHSVKLEVSEESPANGHAMEVDQESGTKVEADSEKRDLLKRAALPFAYPMASDKQMKKLFKGVKSAAKSKVLQRGVKEVAKSLRKMEVNTSSGSTQAIVIIAADISPMDVISHFPVTCEDKGVPYIWVHSRAELGAAGATKRPTSIVMMTPRRKKSGKDVDGAGDDEWHATFTELAKIANEAQSTLTM